MRSHSITLPRSYFLNLNGPVPICASGALRSPYLASTCLAAIRHQAEATEGRNGAAGNLSWNVTVFRSTASTLATMGLSEAPHLGLLKSGWRTRSKVALTSAEEKAWPSCHFTPLRRWKV